MRRSFVLLTLIALGACASSGDPQLSGLGLFNNRHVTQGQILELRIPAPGGVPRWRIASFDSAMLAHRGRALARGAAEIIIRLEARHPGETRLVLQETAGTKQRAININIFPK